MWLLYVMQAGCNRGFKESSNPRASWRFHQAERGDAEADGDKSQLATKATQNGKQSTKLLSF